jgi:hypothetical protein
MKGWRLILIVTSLFLMLLSGCVRFKPYYSTGNMSGFTQPFFKLYKGTDIQKDNFSYVPSSGVFSSSDNSIMNMKKSSLKLSISFPPSARLEF